MKAQEWRRMRTEDWWNAFNRQCHALGSEATLDDRLVALEMVQAGCSPYAAAIVLFGLEKTAAIIAEIKFAECFLYSGAGGNDSNPVVVMSRGSSDDYLDALAYMVAAIDAFGAKPLVQPFLDSAKKVLVRNGRGDPLPSLSAERD